MMSVGRLGNSGIGNWEYKIDEGREREREPILIVMVGLGLSMGLEMERQGMGSFGRMADGSWQR